MWATARAWPFRGLHQPNHHGCDFHPADLQAQVTECYRRLSSLANPCSATRGRAPSGEAPCPRCNLPDLERCGPAGDKLTAPRPITAVGFAMLSHAGTPWSSFVTSGKGRATRNRSMLNTTQAAEKGAAIVLLHNIVYTAWVLCIRTRRHLPGRCRGQDGAAPPRACLHLLL